MLVVGASTSRVNLPVEPQNRELTHIVEHIGCNDVSEPCKVTLVVGSR